MEFLSSIPSLDPFTTDYLGVANWTVDTRASSETGAPDDPITEGMLLPLSWFYAPLNRTDTLVPSPSASTILYNEQGRPNAVRNLAPSGARVVFSTVPQDAISQTAPDPNNGVHLLRQILLWLLQVDPSSAPGPVSGAPAAAGLRAHPNPLVRQTRLEFHLSTRAAAAPVRLTLVDAGGRAVRRLLDDPAVPGSWSVLWDGRDDAGRPVPPGVYLARLNTAAGRAAVKLVVTGAR